MKHTVIFADKQYLPIVYSALVSEPGLRNFRWKRVNNLPCGNMVIAAEDWTLQLVKGDDPKDSYAYTQGLYLDSFVCIGNTNPGIVPYNTSRLKATGISRLILDFKKFFMYHGIDCDFYYNPEHLPIYSSTEEEKEMLKMLYPGRIR